MHKFKTSLLTATLLATVAVPMSIGQGFTEPDVLFYGEVRKSGGGQTVLLQSGKLEMTFVNQSNPANRVTLNTDLYPAGSGANKPYSYALKVPIAYLPEAPRMSAFLSIAAQPTSFKIEKITIDGIPATLPDGSKEFYGLSFASRSGEYRLDLLVTGDSISTAHDGIPDWWKRIYGLDLSSDVSGEDPDGDGWTNLEEFLRGSDPTKSNRVPQLVTSGMRVPDSGEAGIFLQILDSDSSDSAIDVTFSGFEGSGFNVKLDGSPVTGSSTPHLKLSDLKAGRLTVRHVDRTVRQVALVASWSDGGETLSGEFLAAVAAPTVEDGSDAALWLNGSDLPSAGSRIGSWSDRSGNGRSAMQPLAEYQPVAGDKCVDFSTSSLAHLFFQDAALPSADQTVLAAYRAAESADEPQTLLSTNRGFLQIAATTQAISYPGVPTYQMDGSAVRGYQSTGSAVTTSIFRRKANLMQNIFGVSYNGENITPTQIDPVLPTLGARRPAVPTGESAVTTSFGGQLHELLVFPTALGEQKLRDTQNYFESKWGLAVIWNQSTELKPVILAPGRDSSRRIIRGGFAKDQLTGGPGDDIISGGAGDDTLIGGTGSDRFLFGELDTGRKIITDFDVNKDCVDLSALFWGVTGDARQTISVRLDTDNSGPIPTLDSVLIVKLPAGGTREIVLKNIVIGSTQLVQLIVEGRICMGALSIPTTVGIALASGGGGPVSDSFTVNLTRSGPGVSAALDVPVGFLDTASAGGVFTVDGAASSSGQRAVVNFGRGVSSKSLTVHRVPDLQAPVTTNLEVAVLPHYEYSIAGGSVQQAISDLSTLWLEVTEPNAAVTPAQSARVILHRDGNLSQSLVVDFDLSGTAVNGVHIKSIPTTITIPAGQSTYEILVSARATGMTSGAKVLRLQLASRDRYLVGMPPDALLYIGNTLQDASGAGFERWLQTATGGTMSRLENLMTSAQGRFRDYLLAYSMGLTSVDDLWKKGIKLQIIDDQPELTIPSQLDAADIRWSIQSSNDMALWAEAGSRFTQAPAASGLRFVGPPLSSSDFNKFYRVSMNLAPGISASSGIGILTGASRYAVGGAGTWTTDFATGNLVCSGGNAGQTSRVLARVSGPTSINFQMQIDDASSADLLVFSIDGARQSSTSGRPVTVQRTWTKPESHLLMWEFTRGSGSAVIKNISR